MSPYDATRATIVALQVVVTPLPLPPAPMPPPPPEAPRGTWANPLAVSIRNPPVITLQDQASGGWVGGPVRARPAGLLAGCCIFLPGGAQPSPTCCTPASHRTSGRAKPCPPRAPRASWRAAGCMCSGELPGRAGRASAGEGQGRRPAQCVATRAPCTAQRGRSRAAGVAVGPGQRAGPLLPCTPPALPPLPPAAS